MSLVLIGTLASLAAGAMTVVGALPTLFGRHVSDRARDALLGFAAGVMLAASFFSLIIPAIAAATRLYGGGISLRGSRLPGSSSARGQSRLPMSEFLIGISFQGRQGPASGVQNVWLFVAAITIHNFPEGMAVGVAFAGPHFANATALAVGIGLQNAP